MQDTHGTQGERRMQAVVHDRFGGPEVLGLRKIDRPEPRKGEVLLEVHAAGIDAGTHHMVAGDPLLIRVMGFGIRRPTHPVPGLDVAGRVVAVGPEVTAFAPGDEVMGTADGSFAELARAKAAKLVRRPGWLPPAEAAVVPVSGMTAHDAVITHAQVQPGERVLVTGASGGVGSYAVLLAAGIGAEVTGIASAEKADHVRSLGAAHVLDRRSLDPSADDVAGGTGPYDVVIDIAGLSSLARLRRTLTRTGRLVIVGGEGGGRITGGIGRTLRASLLSRFVSQRMRGMIALESAEKVQATLEALHRHDARIPLTRTYPLAEAPKALADLREGRIAGKAAIVVREEG